MGSQIRDGGWIDDDCRRYSWGVCELFVWGGVVNEDSWKGIKGSMHNE